MENRAQHQKRIIKAILERYNAAVGTAYEVSKWPDEEERTKRACDAYAEAPGHVPLAIEHTIIPTFADQKKHDAQFMKAIGDLETELKHSFPYHLSLMIPMFAIEKGQKWSGIKDTLKNWLLTNIGTIPVGSTKQSVLGVPFEVSFTRDDEMPSLFIVARWLDSSLNVPEKLTRCIAGALTDKDDQLDQYRKDGNKTLLILECQDIALVNRATIYRAFLSAVSQVQPKHIDQVWLAETYEPEENFLFIYCLLAEQAFMDQVNPASAMFGPRYAEYWSRVRDD